MLNNADKEMLGAKLDRISAKRTPTNAIIERVARKSFYTAPDQDGTLEGECREARFWGLVFAEELATQGFRKAARWLRTQAEESESP